MCIGLTRLTMSCPACMTNTTGSFQRISCICFFDQVGKTTFCLDDLGQSLAISNGQTGRIISASRQRNPKQLPYTRGPSEGCSHIAQCCRFCQAEGITGWGKVWKSYFHHCFCNSKFRLRPTATGIYFFN